MKFKSLSIIIVFFSFNTIANMQDSYNQAKQYQTKLGNPTQSGIDNNANISNLSNMSDKDLTIKGSKTLNNSPEGQFLQQSEINKINALNEYDLNPNNPLITNSMKIESEPLKHTEGSSFSTNEKVTKIKINKTCREGVEFETDIIKQLHVETELIDEWGDWQDKQMCYRNVPSRWLHRVLLRKKSHLLFFKKKVYGTRIRNDDQTREEIRADIANKMGGSLDQIDSWLSYSEETNMKGFFWFEHYYVVNYRYRERIKEFKEKGEYWKIVNEDAEKLAEENECYEVKRVCLDSGNRIFYNQYNIDKACWKEQITYNCSSIAKNDCDYLKTQGCKLENSNCLKRMSNDICLVWQRNYVCFDEKRELSSSLKGAKMFCLGEDCHTPTIQQNNDITNIVYLAALNEMKNDMKTEPIRVFAGEETNCKKNILNFLNCCSSMKGWAKDLGLKQCRPHEKALALQRAKGLCHFIGTYCSHRDPIFGACLTKKSTYCCFNSKLARIFQEQGKRQLGINWGSAESPDCRGFFVEELQRIDFTKLDLGELFTDLINQARSKMNKSFPKQLQNQIPKMQQQKPTKDGNLSY